MMCVCVSHNNICFFCLTIFFVIPLFSVGTHTRTVCATYKWEVHLYVIFSFSFIRIAVDFSLHSSFILLAQKI